MSTTYILLLLIVWGIFVVVRGNSIERFLKDVSYKYRHENIPLWKQHFDHNQMTIIKFVPIRICFVTLETRSEKYINLHNKNMNRYVNAQNSLQNGNKYTYLFKSECDCKISHQHNPYWCKLFIVRDLLESDQYDYVVWMDSDTVVVNLNLDFTRVLRSYNSHIFCSTDFGNSYTICAGVFVIKNSNIGKQFIENITEYYNSEYWKKMCQTKPDQLNGKWAQTCYEQGAMNNILHKYFKDFTTIFTEEYITNHHDCKAKFILHLFDTSPEQRETCFQTYVK